MNKDFTNDLEQPIGESIPGWTSRQIPPHTRMEGQHTRTAGRKQVRKQYSTTGTFLPSQICKFFTVFVLFLH